MNSETSSQGIIRVRVLSAWTELFMEEQDAAVLTDLAQESGYKMHHRCSLIQSERPNLPRSRFSKIKGLRIVEPPSPSTIGKR